MELEKQLETLQTDLKSYFDKAKEQEKTFGTVLAETKTSIDKLQAQVDAIDKKMQNPGFGGRQVKTITQCIEESESLQRLRRDRKGSAVIQIPDLAEFLNQKTTITSTAVGSATSGVLQIERTPGIVPEARRQLFLRNLLTSIPTQESAIDYVKVNAFSKVVSPQTEAAAKGESEMTFTTATANVRTIATTIPATNQILSDFAGLELFLRSSLAFAVEEEIEDQLISGDNTGLNLNGLTTQAQSFDTSLTTASDGWEKVDLIGRAVQQIAADNEISPNVAIVNTAQAWDIRLQKDSTGQYIFGPPNSGGPTSVFGLTLIPTNAMASGYFAVGTTSPISAVIRDRMGLEIQISTEHSDFFTKNMVMLRAEARLALVVFRPNSYVYGALDTSPA